MRIAFLAILATVLLPVVTASKSSAGQLTEQDRKELQEASRQDMEAYDKSRRHLTVPDCPLSGWFVDYHINVRRTLLTNPVPKPYLQVIALPSFTPEWMVEVEEPAGDSAVVRYVVARSQVWSKKAVAKARTRTATISAERAKLLRDVWLTLLRGVRYSDTASLGEDGTTFHFVAFVLGQGNLNGEVWSPPKQAPTGRLVQLAELLADYAISDDSQRNILGATLERLAREFLSKWEEVSHDGSEEEPAN